MSEGKGLDVGDVCVRTVQRYFKNLGLKRGRRIKGKGQHERYGQYYTNGMWHGDTAHTFSLADPFNPAVMRKAKLVVFVDDASRVIPHGEFYFDEQLPSVLDALAKGLLARGRPERILLDNAKTFRSTTLELMCAELDIGLNFCRPRRPQGKGKIERLIRNIKESFCNEAENAPNITTLDELNAAFRGWMERYENREHGELDGLTPEQRWRKDAHRVDRSLTEARVRQAMMLREMRTVHISTALVTVGKREYQASRELAGREIQVRWNPEQLDQVQLWIDGRCAETAMLKVRKPNVERDWRNDREEQDPKGKKNSNSAAYCAALMGDGMSIAAKSRNTNDLFKLADFVELLSAQLCRSVEAEERALIETAFKRLAPLERTMTENKLAQAIADKGIEQHVRFYLERLEPTALRR
jgi:transposase InsO family protein